MGRINVSMDWIRLEAPEQLQQLLKESDESDVVIYKHSTRCNISRMALDRLDRSPSTFINSRLYFIDVIGNRPMSDLVAETFAVEHESPQLLLISGRNVVLHLSHFEIEPSALGQRSLRN